MTIAGSTFYFWWGAVQQLSVTYLGHNWSRFIAKGLSLDRKSR